ncbi:hypothetical protein L829_1751 [Mycobacteroides abscessus MAB_030201_1075]|uniref:Uncharacterized protein n=1 Tax=Mycobacteroides abscessus MAB_030201_1075 TaxID=1335410 RepID=A0A829PGN1_9MYCO|nr:hypothetical protein [Mycobacteroides abscessus]ETZ70822.1 hypothetical protein L835_3746 [Mycobacteroides abscessus MAB_110811_1470]ETZ88194.1 hypothetical protein L829_1751 [Mycobacteroides abscessus MAB_030201_1075]ETZ95109.1 hypothetical protein L828_3831 [Mycobacteroides abscessus MAB_030201_1061]
MSRKKKAKVPRPTREYFFFVGSGKGGNIPFRGAKLLLDANVIGAGEAILRNGHNPNAVQQRRFLDLIDWMRRHDDADFRTLQGAIEGAEFDGFDVSPLKLANRVRGVEQLINVALDHPDVPVFSGQRPLELFAFEVEFDDVDRWCEVAKKFFKTFVLPNYAVVAKWRLMTQGQHRRQRSPERSRDLLIELSRWLVQEVGWVPVSWGWLCLSELGTQKVSQSIADGVFKLQSADVVNDVRSAAWDSSLISYILTLQGFGDDGRTVLVTDDREFATAAGFIFPLDDSRPGTYGTDLETIRPEARDVYHELTWHRLADFADRYVFSDPADRATDRSQLVHTVRQLQAELGIPEKERFSVEPKIRELWLSKETLTQFTEKFLSADTAAEIYERHGEQFDADDLHYILAIARCAVETLGREQFFDIIYQAARYAYPKFPGDDIRGVFADANATYALELIYYWGANNNAMQMSIENILTTRDGPFIMAHTVHLVRGLLHVWETRSGLSRQQLQETLIDTLRPSTKDASKGDGSL